MHKGFYGSEVESLNVQMLKLRAHSYVWLQVGQLLLFAPEAILECLKSKIFLGGGMLPDPPSGNSLSPDQVNIAQYGPDSYFH